LLNSLTSGLFFIHLEAQQIETPEYIWNADIFIVSDKDPYYSLLSSSIACYYPFENSTSVLKPILINPGGKLLDQHQRFIDSYDSDALIVSIGQNIKTSYETITIDKSPVDLSIFLTYCYSQSSKAMIIPYGTGNDYTNALLATPLSSYLHIPILIYQNNTQEINEVIQDLKIDELFIIGDINPEIFFAESKETFPDSISISNKILSTIHQKFQSINYLTLTNPIDIQNKHVISTNITKQEFLLNNIQITIGGIPINLKGTPIITSTIKIPSGIHHLQYNVNYSSLLDESSLINTMDPYLSCTLKDPNKEVIGYSMSPSYDVGRMYIDTLISNFSGDYTLTISSYHGLKGGFFSSRGFSRVDANLDLTVQYDQLQTSHLPYVQSLSSLAPYLTSAHGGMIIANESFSLTSHTYDNIAEGYATGPCYEKKLHDFNNGIVNNTANEIQKHIDLLKKYGLGSSYLNGPAWLAILGDTNMIPMYYYPPSQMGLYEKGLPSDNPYSLNESLSTGRILGYSISDVSNLICRTFFYETICSNQDDLSWGNTFHFMFGEGYGETGGLFHQIPYSKEIEQYGFESEVYGDLRNSRQYAEKFNVFTGANYNEYLGHGDWFWFIPSIYGFDMYDKSFDVAHLKDWVFEKPSIFLTSACLMGRVDGIPPWMNIGVTLLYAGCNAFVGSTRETGQEAGLEILENSLIINDTSMGEALRKEKREDKIGPTYFVRTLYGDPAFNPYEPNNGFSNQGTP